MDQTDTPAKVASNAWLGPNVAMPAPFDYCYEWDGPYGTRKFSTAKHNGMNPTRSVPLFTETQMRAFALEHIRLQQAAQGAEIDRMSAVLDKALTVCRCAARVVDSSAYQGVSDEDCDLENAVRNWRALGPNARDKGAPTALQNHE